MKTRSKVPLAVAEEIRQLWRTRVTYKALCLKYGLSWATIAHILHDRKRPTDTDK